MSVMVHEISHDLKCCNFRDLVTIQGLLEGRKEVEDSDWLSAAEAATFPLVSHAAVPLDVVAHDIWTRDRGRVVQPISPVAEYLGEADIVRDDRIKYRYG